MTEDFFGKLFGDKGYISKALADLLWGNGIQMITKPLNLRPTTKKLKHF